MRESVDGRTTVTSAKVCTDVLDGCRTMVSGEAGRVGDLGDKLVDRRVDPAVFGDLGGTAELAAAVAEIGRSAGEQLHRAEVLLTGIARSLDAVVTNVTAADGAARTTFTAS
jgi:hypothetical protein